MSKSEKKQLRSECEIEVNVIACGQLPSLLNTKRASEEPRFEHRFGDFCLKLKKGHCRESDIVNESRLNSFPKKPSVVEILSIPNNLIKLTHR